MLDYEYITPHTGPDKTETNVLVSRCLKLSVLSLVVWVGGGQGVDEKWQANLSYGPTCSDNFSRILKFLFDNFDPD